MKKPIIWMAVVALFMVVWDSVHVSLRADETSKADAAEITTTITATDTKPTEGPERIESAVREEDIPAALKGDFNPGDIAAATAWADRLNVADWLGPLAPLALSPFFGVACLSGLTLWGPDAITDNALLDSSSPLRSVPLFAIFAALAVMTSLPRLSKVSKPFSQAMDRLEAYAVVIILLAIKLTSTYAGDPGAGETSLAAAHSHSPIVLQAGVISFTGQTLLMIAMTINLLVINSVKFFFEFLVWLTPLPAVDAMFEIGNKTTCAVLLSIYMFSPILATVLNLLILFLAALIFQWTARRVKFYRTMLLDPILARIWASYGRPTSRGLIVFPQTSIGPFPAKSCLRLNREKSGVWTLQPASTWLPLSWSPLSWIRGDDARAVTLHESVPPRFVRGWLTHTIEVKLADSDPEDRQEPVYAPEACWVLKTSRRHDQQLAVLTETLCLEIAEQATPEGVLKVEFA